MAELKRLVFGEGLMGVVLTGEKRITLRKYRSGAHDFSKGEIVIGEFKDGLDILLYITADTKTRPFSRITDQEAREDGFSDAAAAFNGLKDYYPNLRETDIAATVRFKILTVNDIPVVGVNAHAQ